MRLYISTLLLLMTFSFQLHAARYDMTITGLWNSDQVEPGRFPARSSPHFTRFIGTTHSAGDALWVPGELASKSIEYVAEIGNLVTLRSEIINGVRNGTYGELIIAGSIYRFPSIRTGGFEIFEDKPEITLISMIAPSPDWFVGVSGLSLKDENGWIDDLTVDLKAWDAGTESGDTFTLTNPASSPQQVITRRFAPFVGDPVIGQIRFELVTDTTPVPLPAGIWLFAASCAGLFGFRFKQT